MNRGARWAQSMESQESDTTDHALISASTDLTERGYILTERGYIHDDQPGCMLDPPRSSKNSKAPTVFRSTTCKALRVGP